MYKGILKCKELKKNNEIYCISLKQIYKILKLCISNIEELTAVCLSCNTKDKMKEIMKHICAQS